MAFSFNSLLLIRRENRISSSLELLASTSAESSENSSINKKKKNSVHTEAIEFRFANFAFVSIPLKHAKNLRLLSLQLRLRALTPFSPSDLGSIILIHIHPKGTRMRLRSMQRLWIGHAPSQTFCVCIVLRFRTPLKQTQQTLFSNG